MPQPLDDSLESPTENGGILRGDTQGDKNGRGVGSASESLTLPSETETHRGGGGEGKSQGVKRSVPQVLAAHPPAPLRPSGNSGGGGSEVVGGSGSGNGGGVGNGNGSGSGGKLKKVKPVAPAKVLIKVVTQAKTFRCIAAPTDTWAHVCALVQVLIV